MSKQLPHGWQEFALKDICDIQDGIHTTPNYVDKGIKFISVENINNIYASNKFISNEDYNNLYKVKAKKNDIFMTRIGDIGTPAIVTKDEELAYYVTLTLLTNISKEIYYKYLYYAIQSYNFQKELYSRTLHVAFPKKINLGEIGECKFISPSIDEQKRIADILSTFDDLIENLTKLIEKKEIYKKGVMQRVLSGEVRFNGFTNEWKTMRIGDICEYKNGNSFENYIDENGKLFLITLDSITIDGRLKNNHKKINIDTKELLSKNDIVMILSDIAHGYFLGLTAVIDKDNCYVLNQRVALLKPNNIIVNSYFLSKLININQKYFKKYGQGSSQQNLQKKSVENFIVKIPSLEEQNKIAELLTLIDKDIEILKQLLHLRKLQKKGVMQKLLTGEVRV